MTPDTTDTTPRLRLPLIEGGQALKHITHNEALLDLDTLLFISLEDLAATTPPEGDHRASVVVGPDATDSFSGRTGQIASRVDGAWRFYTPQRGQTAWLSTDATQRTFDGTEWVTTSGSGGSGKGGDNLSDTLPQLGIGTTADTTNRLAVKSSAALFTHNDQGDAPTGDVRINLNRATSTDTAAFNFQTGYGGTAEFGLVGDSDFRIKTSPDGNAFNTALRVATASTYVGIGEREPLSELDVNRSSENATVHLGVTNTAAAISSSAAVSAHAGPDHSAAITQYASGSAFLTTTGGLITYRASSENGWHRFFSSHIEVMRIRHNVVSCKVPLQLPSKKVSDLPTPVAGHVVFVSDDAQGAAPAYADGTNWRRMSDRTVVD